MTDPTFGERLQAARRRAGYRTQQALGDVLARSARTIRNWETGATMPDLADLESLRKVLGPFDLAAGDPVEAAVRQSRLTEDRQYVVIATYKRELREQDEEAERRRGA